MTPSAFFLPKVDNRELILLALVCLVIFGNRLPSVMRALGESITEFKRGIRK